MEYAFLYNLSKVVEKYLKESRADLEEDCPQGSVIPSSQPEDFDELLSKIIVEVQEKPLPNFKWDVVKTKKWDLSKLEQRLGPALSMFTETKISTTKIEESIKDGQLSLSDLEGTFELVPSYKLTALRGV